MFDVLRIVCSIIRVRVWHYFLLAPNTQPLTQACTHAYISIQSDREIKTLTIHNKNWYECEQNKRRKLHFFTIRYAYSCKYLCTIYTKPDTETITIREKTVKIKYLYEISHSLQCSSLFYFQFIFISRKRCSLDLYII